jgi:hypothetical protein
MITNFLKSRNPEAPEGGEGKADPPDGRKGEILEGTLLETLAAMGEDERAPDAGEEVALLQAILRSGILIDPEVRTEGRNPALVPLRRGGRGGDRRV